MEHKEGIKTYYQKNREKLREKAREYRQGAEIKTRRRIYNKKYRRDHLEEIRIKDKKYREDNLQELKEKAKIYYQSKGVKERRRELARKPENKAKKREHNQRPEIKAKLKEYFKKYQKENHQKIKERNHRYYQDNKVKVRRNSISRERIKKDPQFNLIVRLRSRLGKAFGRYTKTGKIAKARDYGINYEAIIQHLQPSPENLSNYHIDHIKPLSSFNFINEDGSTNGGEIQKAFAPENHQWLTAEENMKKGNKQ